MACKEEGTHKEEENAEECKALSQPGTSAHQPSNEECGKDKVGAEQQKVPYPNAAAKEVYAQ